MSWWQIALWVLAGLLLLLYVIGPIIVYRTFWYSTAPTIDVLSASDLPEDAQTFFVAAREQFEKVGFRDHWGDYRIKKLVSGNQEQYICAMVNPETRESGGAVFLIQKLPHQQDMVVKGYGFSSELNDHTEIATANSTNPSLPINSDQYREIILPDIWDIELLYKIHRFSLEQSFGNQVFWLPETDNAIEAIQYTLLKPARALEQMGLLRLDAGRHKYVPTLKGSYLMTWQELWPLKWLRQYKLKKLAKELIRACR